MPNGRTEMKKVKYEENVDGGCLHWSHKITANDSHFYKALLIKSFNDDFVKFKEYWINRYYDAIFEHHLRIFTLKWREKLSPMFEIDVEDDGHGTIDVNIQER